jgi:Bacterial protein of unknown function (DUF885)
VTTTSAPAFTAWLDDFFASYFACRPVNATFIGVHDYDDELPDITALAGEAEVLLARLRALPPESLSTAQKLDRQLSEGFLLVQRWESASTHFGWRNPSLFTSEAIFGVIGLLLQHRSAASRMAMIPDFLDDTARELQPAPRAWIEQARRECTGAQLLLRGLDALPAADAFARLDERLQRLEATEDYACGAEAFALLLRSGHFLDVSADELERLALERLAELEAEAPAEVGTRAPEGPYLQRFHDVWQATVELAEQHDLLTLPDWPVRYVEKPEWAREAAPYLYFLPYRSPPPLDMPRSVDYYAPAGADEATIKLNHVVHHGSLGHHVQNWHAARTESRIGRIAAVDCASRIAMLCGGTMAEGWACYATDLADEAGFLTPAEQYAQHQTRRRMAARAVVDIRLHDGRFSLAEAAAFYEQRVGMLAAAAQSEAVKNSLFPATACMYLAGWEGIQQLRREVQPTSLREFHDRLLSFGSVPVALIAKALVREEICL